jgi:hypothetical protein
MLAHKETAVLYEYNHAFKYIIMPQSPTSGGRHDSKVADRLDAQNSNVKSTICLFLSHTQCKKWN